MSHTIVRNKSGKIVIRRSSQSSLWLKTVLSVLLVLTLWGFLTIDTKGTNLLEAAGLTLEYFGDMFFAARGVPAHFGLPGDSSYWAVFLKSFDLVLITLSLAFLTTAFGAIIALALSFFAARNLSTPRVSSIIRGFVAFIRAVPTVLWVLIFAIGAGLGAVAAVIGMSFHTIGYLLKAYSESIEEIDPAVIEALRASGASWIQIIFQAVLPSTLGPILSWTFVRFEINFAVAVAMGAAAGAGGIGYNMYIASTYFYDIREIGFITYQILAVALVMEFFANKLKSRFHLHS